MKIGDIVIPKLGICIERKEVKDFCGSVMDGRIFEQMDRMIRSEYKYCAVFVVGSFNDIVFDKHYRKFSIKQQYGAFASLMANNFPFREVPDWSKFMLQLDFYIKQAEKGDGHILKPKPLKHKGGDQTAIILTGTGITYKQAEEILKVYSLQELFTVSIEDLTKIRGIGKKSGEKVKKYFDTYHKE